MKDYKNNKVDPDLVETGKRIRTIRESLGMSQEQLAERLGVNKNSIYRYENGHMEMKISMLYKLADLFGVSVNELAPARFCIETDDSTILKRIVKLFRKLNNKNRAIAVPTIITLLTNMITSLQEIKKLNESQKSSL